MANIVFEKVGGSWRGELTSIGKEQTIHLNRKQQGSVEVYCRPSVQDGWSKILIVEAVDSDVNQEVVINRPLGYLIRVVSQSEVVSANYNDTTTASGGQETEEIDTIEEVASFLEGIPNDKTLQEVIDEGHKLDDEEMENLTSMFPTS